MKLSFDTHIHSTFSCDAADSAEDMVVAAIAKGLTSICFTEHVDYNPLDFGYWFFDYAAYANEMQRLKVQYADKIEIFMGIEFSEPHLYVKEFEQERSRDYDMVMAALHWMDDKFYGQQELIQEYPLQKIMQRYFEDLLRVVSAGGFDVLAHFDFPRRYYGRQQADEAVIEQILKTMIQNGIVPEINTSGLRKGYEYTLPDFDVLDRYIALGGQRALLGSDAHSTGEIAAGFEHIDQYCHIDKLEFGVFRNRVFVPLKG